MARKNTMRNRDYFLPSITTLVLSGLVWFLSCAHQNRMREEEDSSFEQAAEQQLSESNKAEAAPPENSTPAETQAVPKDEFAFGSEGEKAQKTILKAKQSEPIAEPAPEAAPEPTNTAANTSASEEWTEPQAEPAKTEEAQAQTEAPVVSPEPENKAPEIQPQESVPETPRKRYVLTTPKIPSKAIVRGGSKLNRFYFARKGDSPKKVSQLIYGNSNFAKKLVLWNGKIWSPGKVVFYSSPVSPKDKRMASFYQERNIQPDEYQVNAGDWLTRIAKKHLGSAKSWKESVNISEEKPPNFINIAVPKQKKF
ncbi:hypothetical protein EBT16_07195 [bacterium]|nr:hypothetical protein [bacterium]